MILPSKELLSEVLEINDINLIIYDIDFPNIIEYTQYANITRGVRSTEINIYELAHKCKEWAISKGYDVLSGGLEAGLYSCYIDYADKRYTLQMSPLYHTFEDTEPEAIFNATQYIYDNLFISPLDV